MPPSAGSRRRVQTAAAQDSSSNRPAAAGEPAARAPLKIVPWTVCAQFRVRALSAEARRIVVAVVHLSYVSHGRSLVAGISPLLALIGGGLVA